MKLFDKIKDLFVDEIEEEDDLDIEEEEELEEKSEPEKVELPKVMRDTILEEEKEQERKREAEFKDFSFDKEIEKELPKREESKKKFSFPMDFEEDIPKREETKSVKNTNVLEVPKQDPVKKVSELYPDKRPEFNTKPKFKATPVISPVYGVLDKNYTKEEVKEKDEENVSLKRPSRKVDFETVRKKAFGNLSDDIKDNLLCENCELYKEVKKIQALSEDDLLYDMTVDENEDITINRAYENYEEFGVAYEGKRSKLREEIDRRAAEEENAVQNDDEVLEVKEEVNDEVLEEEVVLEKPEVIIEDKIEDVPLEEEVEESSKEIPTREKKSESSKVDADFFELIDSMYKERSDE